MTTRGSTGHVMPLAPFGHACLRAGHEVMVAAQRQHRANVERAGLTCVALADPPADQWMPLLEQFARLDVDAAHARMIGEYFAQLDTRATLPGLRTIVEEWQPDIIVRESWEFASTLVAELHEIPLVRVGLGLAAVEELSAGLAATGLEPIRAQLGLPSDAAGDRLRATPYFTIVPEALEDPAIATPSFIRRFAPATPAVAAALPDWWPGNDAPLVYLSFGTVTASSHLPYFPVLYRAAIDALAGLDVRILVTVGEDRDPGELGPLPSNVQVERWVANDRVGPHAAAIVCHGGYGSSLGALWHGVPMVVLPLFSSDQRANADAIARAGAGVALASPSGERGVLDLPGPEIIGQLGVAVQSLLDDASYRRQARRVAGAMRALPPVDAAVDALAQISREAGLRHPQPAL
jgi:UDP:flavonoid glycosyltransferase YjiC (YdhE family)